MSDENPPANLEDLARKYLAESKEGAIAYLRQAWLSGTVAALRGARRAADLTQEEVAQRLGTTQSAIARLERDDEGRMALHRYVDYAVVCDKLPLDIELVNVDDLRHLAEETPSAPRTRATYEQWTTSAAATAPIGSSNTAEEPVAAKALAGFAVGATVKFAPAINAGLPARFVVVTSTKIATGKSFGIVNMWGQLVGAAEQPSTPSNAAAPEGSAVSEYAFAVGDFWPNEQPEWRDVNAFENTEVLVGR